VSSAEATSRAGLLASLKRALLVPELVDVVDNAMRLLAGVSASDLNE